MHPQTRFAPMKRATSAHGLNFIISSRFVSIALFVLLTVSPPAPAAANLFSGGVKSKQDVTLSILSSKTFYAANEPVLVDVILKNNELKKPARILDWLVPCQEDTASPETPTEMSYFSINTADGYVAKYLGAVFKRAEPVGKDYKMLMPGEEVSCTIDLGQYYDFASKSDDNSYVIKYSVKSIELSPKASSGEGALESLESNALTIRIDARNVPTRSLRERKLQSLNSFRSCDTTKQSMLVEARSRAYSASSGVLGVIDSVGRSSSSQSCPRYKEWFGDFNSNRHNELRTGYLISRDQLNSASITFDCGCTSNTFSYVYPNRPYEIFLCKYFWSSPMTGSVSKPGVIVHEMSHFLATSGTDDYAYYQANCKKLAINNPGLAVNNADSHEFIAENTPSLSCAAGPSSPCLGMDVEVSIKTDEYPGETTWTLSDSCGTGRTLSGGPYSQANSLISVRECLPAGKYVFTINDAEGDGLCCGFGTGWYNIVVNGVTTYAGGLFGGSETKTFGECATSTSKPSLSPSLRPTSSKPTADTTNKPTSISSNKPTTNAPTPVRTIQPTTSQPTTMKPTTISPTSNQPTSVPTSMPTDQPTTSQPTTMKPTTISPTTKRPTSVPTSMPTDQPTTSQPTTMKPITISPTTKRPTSVPTKSPTNVPTMTPTTETPTTSSPNTDSPTTYAPTTDSPTTSSPTTDSPTTNAPTTDSPTTSLPTTESPSERPSSSPSEKPSEQPSIAPSSNPSGGPSLSPSSNSPTTDSPTTSAPTTAKPTTRKPTLVAGGSTKPTSRKPSTRKPTTRTPTQVPTNEPTTESPTTNAPTTNAPSSNSPTTILPTTALPTSDSPTSAYPTTDSPSTAQPSSKPSSKPTTSKPTTRKPTTRTPTTFKPTTGKPVL